LFIRIAAEYVSVTTIRHARVTATTCAFYEIERVMGIGTYERDRE